MALNNRVKDKDIADDDDDGKLEQKPDTEEGRGAMNSKCPHPPTYITSFLQTATGTGVHEDRRETANRRKRTRL